LPPPGYLDAATAEPVHPAAIAAAAAAGSWADPGRRYALGRRSRLLLDTARQSLADFLGCRSDELHFLPSAQVAGQAAIRGVTAARRRRLGQASAGRLVMGAVEHSGLLAEADLLSAESGLLVTRVPVDERGAVSAATFLGELAPDTTAAVLQVANHEVGTRQPVGTVGSGARALGVPLLVDATASAGRLPLPPDWSAFWADPRLWGGLPGVGCLGLRTGFDPPLAGDRSERGAWPGPVPVPLVVAAAAAAEAVSAQAEREDRRLFTLIDRLRAEIPARIPDAVVLGHPTERLPHVLTVSFLYVAGEALLDDLDRAGFACSSGSACATDNVTIEPSHVLAAMGALTHGNLRISLPRGCRESDVDRLLAHLPAAVERARGRSNAAAL
jgi:cysteine desulfurase